MKSTSNSIGPKEVQESRLSQLSLKTTHFTKIANSHGLESKKKALMRPYAVVQVPMDS